MFSTQISVASLGFNFTLLVSALTIIAGVWLCAVVMVCFVNSAWLTVWAVTGTKVWQTNIYEY